MAPTRSKTTRKAASSSSTRPPATKKARHPEPIEELNEPADANPHFVVPEAQDRFAKCFKNSAIVQERAFPHDDPHPAFEIIQQNQWTYLCTQPEDGYVNLVKEFFSNAMFCEEGNYLVRGSQVLISMDRIRQYYNLPIVKSCKYQELMADESHLPVQAIKRRITKGNIEAGIVRSNLREAAKFWHYFICHNVLPTSHFHKISWQRATLIYCIMERFPVDLAAIIYKELIGRIKSMAASTTGTIFTMRFPHMISALCLKQGVVYSIPDKLEPLQPFKLASPGKAIREEIALNASQHGDPAEHNESDASTPVLQLLPKESLGKKVLREITGLKQEISAQKEAIRAQNGKINAQTEEIAALRAEIGELKDLVRTNLVHQRSPTHSSA